MELKQDQKLQDFKIIKIQDNQFKNECDLLCQMDCDYLWNQDKLQKFLAYEQTCKSSLEAHCSHGFLSAFFYAYNRHGNVKVTPDDVWLTIMLYFSDYVKNNAQQLKKAFINHQGKKELVIQTKNELLQTLWQEFFSLIIQQIRKNTTKDVSEKLQCNFSTTGRTQTILSTALLINTHKQYFEYTHFISNCGIHEVHLGGTLEDWQKLYKKAEQLKKYDVNGELNKYLTHLLPLLQQFIETYKGKVDVQFWNKIIRKSEGVEGSGTSSKFSGWLTHFFGYYQEVEQIKIPIIEVEIKIVNKITGSTKPVKLVGGFAAVNQQESKDRKTYRPHMSMAILQEHQC